MVQQGKIKITLFGISDTGVVRSQNQDSYLAADLQDGTVLADFSARRFRKDKGNLIDRDLSQDGNLLAVADGMGGAAAGDIASFLGLETLLTELNRARTNGARVHLTTPDLLKLCIEKSNFRLWEESQMNIDYRGMGTTLTAVLVKGSTAYIAEVGDSRAYLLRGNRYEQLTKDQSAVQMLIDLGRMTKDQALSAPNRNIILQALGVDPTIQVALMRLELRQNDQILLCSDGLSNKLEDDEMRDILLTEPSLDDACQTMVELANLRGGEDNITILLAKFVGEDLKEAAPEEDIWRTIEMLSIFFPMEGRRGVQTSKLPRVKPTDDDSEDDDDF